MGTKDILSHFPFFASGPDRQALIKAWPIIGKHLDKILDDFYRHISTSSLNYILEKIDVPRLKQKQREHWRRIILEGFDADYIDRVNRMHRKHIEIGLPSTYYVMSYLFMLKEFRQAILKDAKTPQDASAMLESIDTLIALDVSRALFSYYEVIDIKEIDEELSVDEPAREESQVPVWIGIASGVVIVLGITAIVWMY
jgi:hypothetical protein